METKQIAAAKSYTIPIDVFMDILRILLKNELRYQIEGINEKENSIMLRICFKADAPYRKNIKENIESILSDYGYYMNGALNSDWEEEEYED